MSGSANSEAVPRGIPSPRGWRPVRPALSGLLVAFTTTLLLQAQETLIPAGANWRYRKGTNEVSSPTTAWRARGFTDTSWPVSAAPFHYGEGLSTGTPLNDMRNSYTCVFLRRTFVVTNLADLTSLTLEVAYDDGFVAWINEVEVARQNVSGEPTFNATATANHEALPAVSFSPTRAPDTYLVEGANVIAIQAFNRSLSASSDFQIHPTLAVTRKPGAPPAIASVSPPAGPTPDALAAITVTFDQPVLGVDATDLVVNGRPATDLTALDGGAAYTFHLPPPPPGIVAVSWDEAHGITGATGAAFDAAQPGAAWSYTLSDRSPPALLDTAPVPGAQARVLTEAVVLFHEPVEGLDLADFLINGVIATNLAGSGAGPYTFTFPQPAAGTVRFTWAGGHAITDLADPPNAFAGAGWTVTLDPAAGAENVRLNEFLAASLTGLRDEDGTPQDWIELHNAGTTPVNLLGWSLTDDDAVPRRWTFPATVLPPGGYLVVFASGKDRRSPAAGARYHTNFRLNPLGEPLALFNADSPPRAVTVFAPEYPPQRNDHSYGLDPAAAWRHYAAPTPGAANGTSAILGAAPEPHFSVTRGLYDRPFTLLLTTPQPGASIRYTTDGSEPTPASGTRYTAPLVINRTLTLRAATFAPDHLPSLTRTHTYVFPALVPSQPAAPAGYPATWGTAANFPGNIIPADYEMDPEIVHDPRYAARMFPALMSLPVIALSLPVDEMFGPDGIYAHPLSRGPRWERPVSFEFFTPDGDESYQENAGVQIQGNAAREPQKNPKHPMRLTFKGDYGATRLEQAVFPDSPVDRFDTLILRADFNYSWLHWNPTQRTRAQRTRDSWAKDVFRAMGSLASHNRYAHLYLNGLYWGIYDLSERPDGAFAASHLGGEKEDYDVINEGAAVDGDMTAYNQMLALAAGNLADPAQYDRLKTFLDLPQYIDYMLFHFYVGHEDWGLNKNWYTFRRRDGTAGGFRYLPWDQEMILGAPTYNRVNNPDVPSGLHQRLLASPEYRLDFADAVRRHCFHDGALTPSAVTNAWLRRSAEIETALPAESARWGDYRRDVHPYQSPPYELYTPDNQWQAERQRLLTQYFPQRTAVLVQQLRDAGLYPGLDPPEFNQNGGRVPDGFALTLAAPAGTIFYTLNGGDPRIYGSGGIAPGAHTYDGSPLVLHATTEIRARVRQGTTWSALATAVFTVGSPLLPLRFTEIMYHPPGGDAFEFVELENHGPTTLDLSGFSFDGLGFLFPDNTVLAPGAVIVLASAAHPDAFAARYPGLPVTGWFEGSLSNGGERLALHDRTGRTVAAVRYDDEDGWPLAADGGGASLERHDPQGDPHSPASWRASSSTFGTPGHPPSPAPPPLVTFDEVMADNAAAVPHAGGFPDWLELRNRSAQTVDLAGWSLGDTAEPHRFVFPPGTTLAAGARLVVWCDTATQTPGLHSGFALDRDGECLFLHDAQGRRIDVLAFGRQVKDRSLGRVDGHWRLTLPTPGETNRPADLAPVTQLVLNEWLVNAAPGTDDWLELHNRSATAPVPLQGLHVATENALAALYALAFLGPGEHLRLRADEQPGPDHLELKLPAAGGPLVLLDASGLELNRVTTTAQPEGVSEGRFPDGTPPIVPFPGTASPGAPNHTAASAGPRLAEVLALSGTPGPWGAPAGWVELANPTATNLALAGFALGTSTRTADRWAFPADTVLAPGARLVLWCDPGQPPSLTSVPPVNTGLRLDPASLDLLLFNAAGQVLDALAAGFQVRDLPLGRPSTHWQLLAAPTPGQPEDAPAQLGPPSALRINEWMAAPTEGNDWFELHNTADLPVALAGLFLTDTPSIHGRTNTRIAPLSFIAPRGWVVFRADGSPGRGRDHTRFSLDAAGETLQLHGADLAPIDVIDFGLQAAGVSQGRLPDGTLALADFPGSATPGTSNRLTDTDTDGDGLPDDWETAHGTDPETRDAEADPDGDGLTNREEYLAGTLPRDPTSTLRLDVPTPAPGAVLLRFQAQPGRSYAIQSRPVPGDGTWETVRRWEESETSHVAGHRVNVDGSQRFFRLVTPAPE